VTDAISGKPLAGAAVTVSQHGKQPNVVNTDSHGRYDVWQTAGSSTITVTADGHRAGGREVMLKHGRATTADFALTKS
jgi:carboxypeptidase family protein